MVISLCGFMGCGKSTVGETLAIEFCYEFIDTDQRIEHDNNISISQVFANHGESVFRQMESECIRQIIVKDAVVSLGGGAVLDKHNVDWLKKQGKIIFLDVPFDVCYSRIVNSNRPIVTKSTQSDLKELYDKRKSIYLNLADEIVRGESSSDIVEVIKNLFVFK